MILKQYCVYFHDGSGKTLLGNRKKILDKDIIM